MYSLFWFVRRTSSTKLNSGVIGAEWLVGLGVWFSLRVREVPGSNPGRALGCVLHLVCFTHSGDFMTKQPKYGMGVEPSTTWSPCPNKYCLPACNHFGVETYSLLQKKECLIRIINYPKEKVQPKYVSKLCFYVKLTIDRILLICIIQFFCSSKHTLPKNSRIYIFVSYLTSYICSKFLFS